jgi:hypothetical protein
MRLVSFGPRGSELPGLEAAAGVRYHLTGIHAGKTMSGCLAVIRYADDRVPRTRLEVAM